MTFTTNRVLIDTSILVEYIKGTKTELLSKLIEDSSISCCINETIISEFLYQFLKVTGGTSPQSLQSSGKIASLFSQSEEYAILKLFHVIPSDDSYNNFVPYLMATYNLLPNDAIILATCKIHNITKLASHDTDFIIPCKEEGIELLRED